VMNAKQPWSGPIRSFRMARDQFVDFVLQSNGLELLVGFGRFVEKRYVTNLDLLLALEQLAAALVERKSGADLQTAGAFLLAITHRRRCDPVAIDHAEAMNGAVQQATPFQRVRLLHLK